MDEIAILKAANEALLSEHGAMSVAYLRLLMDDEHRVFDERITTLETALEESRKAYRDLRADVKKLKLGDANERS